MNREKKQQILEKLEEIGVDGVIIGRALYNGALDLGEVLANFAG